MKIVIVGPGAMGCLFGVFLAKSGQEVYFLDKNKARAKEIQGKGILVEGLSNFSVKNIKATTEAEEIGEANLVILATKSYDTEGAIKNVLSIIEKETLVLTLQNGLGNVEIINRYVAQNKIIAGVTNEGATLLGIGHIRHAGKGETILGAISNIKNQISKIEEIVEIFNRAGFETKITERVEDLIWSKLMINVGINALTAILHLNNGRLVEISSARQIMLEAVKEAEKIVKKKKIKLLYKNPVEKVEEVCRLTAGNVSSMLQDVLKKRRTEIDFINGAIVNEGKKLGIPTPVNSVLTDLVKTIEGSYPLQIY
ncbi:MAG: 2-dehydropantoate 2-reductase [Candidatus Omnitrophica bacterium]|nr:2-dehydropantoate 2-reductase [Candidatus Omnitrophota bacterium]MCM8793195.1 2-dehydropantoate 2-reductase [Candidatus Omnitrophota bacterium]